MIALLASPWGAPVLAVLSLAAVAAGAGLGAAGDRMRTAHTARRRARQVRRRLAHLLVTQPLGGPDRAQYAAGAARLAAAAHGRHRLTPSQHNGGHS